MELDKLKEPFPQSKISWRGQTMNREGTKALALAYIDSRDVQERLDEVCGVGGWQCEYPHANGKTICSIGIKCNNEWVWKADGAGDTDVEAEKGAISDAFKRAGVKWGIGRYLYNDEFKNVWVPCSSTEFNGKKKFKEFTDSPWKYVKGIKQPESKLQTPNSPATLSPANKKQYLTSYFAELASGKDIDAINATIISHAEELTKLLGTYKPDIKAQVQAEIAKHEKTAKNRVELNDDLDRVLPA